MKVGSRTPWGKADFVTTIAEGVHNVVTPGHGGYKLNSKNNALVHAAWRQRNGWYEEDCEWAIVAFTFPKLFKEKDRDQAVTTLKSLYPDEYEQVTGIKVEVAESHKLRQRQFEQDSKNKLVVTAAYGDWHRHIPKGFVGGYAVLGGDRSNPGKTYLIPSETYNTRSSFGFVFNPGDFPEIENFV